MPERQRFDDSHLGEDAVDLTRSKPLADGVELSSHIAGRGFDRWVASQELADATP